MKINSKTITKTTLAISIIGILRFCSYNYIENTPGQARALRMQGLVDFVCKDLVQNPVGYIDDCGEKSVYGDSDWGITAYYSIYGIRTTQEANEIVRFMEETRHKNKQDHIPIEVEFYSQPRSLGSSRPQKYKILSRKI